METPQGKSAINCYQMKEQHLLHRYKEPCPNYDLMDIIFVYLGNSKVKDQLINLLDLMFKLSKNASEKITTLHNDFGIDLTQEGEGGCSSHVQLRRRNIRRWLDERQARRMGKRQKRR